MNPLFLKSAAAITLCALFFTCLPSASLAGGGSATGYNSPGILSIKNTAENTLGTTSSGWTAISAGGSAGVDFWTKYKTIAKEMGTLLLSRLLERMMATMTQDIVDWIKGKTDQPKFITDFGAFVTDAVDQTVGDFIDSLGYGFLCESFGPFIKMALQEPPFVQRARCSITDIVGNLQSFYDNFDNGGWTAWLHLAENPQNTVHGGLLMAMDERDRLAASKAAEQQLKAITGGGFAPLECTEAKIAAGACGREDKGKILTPGALILNMANTAITGEYDKKNLEIALFKSQAVSLSPYLTAIADALIWRLTKESLSLLGDTNVAEPAESSWKDPTYRYNSGQSGIGQGDKQVLGDSENAQKLLNVFTVYEQTIRGVAAQGAGGSLQTLLKILQENRRLAKNISAAGDCEADPGTESIDEQISEINGYIEALSGPQTAEGNEKINAAKQAINDYIDALDGYLNDFSNRLFIGTTAEEDEAEKESIVEKQRLMFEAVIVVVFGEEGAGERLESYRDEEGVLLTPKLTEAVNNKITQISSDVPNSQDEALATIGLTKEQVGAWIDQAYDDNNSLRRQYDACLGTTYQPEGGGTTIINNPTNVNVPDIPSDWNG